MVYRIINRLALALLLLLSISATIFLAQADDLPEHINNHGPFHLSWSSNQTRWDFVFSPKNITASGDDLTSLVGSNWTTLAQCQGQKGCLFKEGKLLQAYNSSLFTKETLILTSPIDSQLLPNSPDQPCKKSVMMIYNHCSTHWNPPIHITGNECKHTIEWHSPYSCSASQTNYERPCYVHDPSGKLIDLTHLVLSNGTSYEINTGNFSETIKSFHMNVCNEATKSCGSNLSSCLNDNKNLVETGYSNLTSITYNSTEKSVHLVSLGQFNEKCADKRVKTIVRFSCPKQYVDPVNPELVKADDCNFIIDWPTVRACPLPDVQAPATSCAIKYEPLGIDINLKSLFINLTSVEVSGIDIGGKNKTMLLGLCQGINPSEYRCAGKGSRSTSACLLDGGEKKLGDAKNSEIVGSVTKSTIKLTDSHILLESFATNKTCEVPVTNGFNYTRQVGTRIEFVCSETDALKPKFAAFEDCVYVFEWGSSKLCLENMISQTQPNKHSDSTTLKPTITPAPSSSQVPITNHTDSHKNPNFDDTTKTPHDMHKDTMADSKEMMDPEKTPENPPPKPQIINPESKKDSNSQTVQPTGKMNKVHKFFMIGLIVMSLTAFVVVIFILDRKTNFKIPLGRIGRRARQALRPQPVPYTRVGFNDNLDL